MQGIAKPERVEFYSIKIPFIKVSKLHKSLLFKALILVRFCVFVPRDGCKRMDFGLSF